MRAWLESIAGPEYASALMWTVFALIGLLVLLILIRIVRGLTFGTFVAGGRNRKARLAVMDATAVDSHRRLVLVRRDDVEHLILIGGPSDVVVEQNIRIAAPAKRAAGDETVVDHQNHQTAAPERAPQAHSQPVAMPRPAAQPPRAAPPTPRPVVEQRYQTMPPVKVSPVTVTPVASKPATVTPVASRPATVTPAASRPATVTPVPAHREPASPPTPPRAAAAQPNLDDALLQELEVSLETEKRHAGHGSSKPADRTLDEEMSKLLGDLSSRR